MKKLILLIAIIIFVNGCQNVDDLSMDEVIETFAIHENKINIYRTGYKFYLPRGMQINDNKLFNEVITNNKYTFYLYVDAVSYLKVNQNLYSDLVNDYYDSKITSGETSIYNITDLYNKSLVDLKISNNFYTENSEIYYSKEININDEFGYLEINLVENGKYLIEIMYNYAKIEVMVSEEDINTTVLDAITVLKTIEYNSIVIENLLNDETINFVESEYNIFNTTTSDIENLTFDNTYIPPEDVEYDQDLLY